MMSHLRCSIFGHRYVTEVLFSPIARKVTCSRCGSSWAMNDDVRALVPWDGQFEKLYRMLGQWPGIKPKPKDKYK